MLCGWKDLLLLMKATIRPKLVEKSHIVEENRQSMSRGLKPELAGGFDG
jgi:hypothetical protein